MSSEKVECDVEYETLENDEGRMIDGVVVSCSLCGHTVESFGRSGRSIRRCLALLSEECPEGVSNYYTAEGSDD